MTRELGSGVDIFLNPGDWFFGDRQNRIHTTLGSCIAVTLWHPNLRLGGMCHFMLPARQEVGGELNARYGDDAMDLLIGEIRRLGTRPEDYESKLFGGASLFDLGPQGNSVARRNIEAAEALMVRFGFAVAARSLGGSGYRQLLFNIAKGDVWVRQGSGQDDSAGLNKGEMA